MQQTTTRLLLCSVPQKCIPWRLTSNGNWISWTFSMRPLTLQPHGQLCLTLLISHHPRPFFNLEPSFLCEPELKTTIVEVYCGNGSNIRKASSDSCGNDLRKAHQNWESWKISRAHKVFRRSHNWFLENIPCS